MSQAGLAAFFFNFVFGTGRAAHRRSRRTVLSSVTSYYGNSGDKFRTNRPAPLSSLRCSNIRSDQRLMNKELDSMAEGTSQSPPRSRLRLPLGRWARVPILGLDSPAVIRIDNLEVALRAVPLLLVPVSSLPSDVSALLFHWHPVTILPGSPLQVR
jgi:hypothetical protein